LNCDILVISSWFSKSTGEGMPIQSKDLKVLERWYGESMLVPQWMFEISSGTRSHSFESFDIYQKWILTIPFKKT
jgi:hypothetical protein